MSTTQIAPDGRRYAVDELPAEATAAQRDYKVSETQIAGDGLRQPVKEVASTATREGKALAKADPGRTLEQTPRAFVGTQVDAEDGLRKPLEVVNPDAAKDAKAAAKETPVSDTDDPETASEPGDVEAVTAARVTAQGLAGMPQSADVSGLGPYGQPSLVERATAAAEGGTDGEPDDPRTVEQLTELAREYEVEGYSTMNKPALSAAVVDADPRTTKDLQDAAKKAEIPGRTKMGKRDLIFALAAAEKDAPPPEPSSSGSTDDGGTGAPNLGGEQPSEKGAPTEPTEEPSTAPADSAQKEGAPAPDSGSGQPPMPSAGPSGTAENPAGGYSSTASATDKKSGGGPAGV